MNVEERYVVYGMNRIDGSPYQIALTEVDFSDIPNSFDNEKDAIEALVSDEDKHYEDFVILKQIHVS